MQARLCHFSQTRLTANTATGKGPGFSLPRFGPYKNAWQQAKVHKDSRFGAINPENFVSPTMTFFFGVISAN